MNDERAPIPISQAIIHVVLQYISQASPLPPYLISKSLLQRHYLLQLTPDDYVPYLVWPGSPTDCISVALSNFSAPAIDQHASYPIAYSSDPDAVAAHVCVATTGPISSHMRLVFLWDNEAFTWKYHNLALMPFPTQSVSTIDQLMKPFDQPETDETSYWGSSDDLDETDSHDGERLHAPESEDDYWARYLGVQGSGDSTVPSPPRAQQVRQVTESHEEPGRVMMTYPTTQTEIYDPLKPPSPEQLARRLATIATQSIHNGVPSRSGTDSPTLSPDQAHPQDLGVILNAVDPKSADVDEHPSDAFLRDAIKSIYHLWKEGRPGAYEGAFMDIVRQSIHTT